MTNVITMPIEPNENNALTDTNLNLYPVYARYNTLAKLYDISIGQVRTVASKMQKDEYFRKFVIYVGKQTPIIEQQAFRLFLTKSKTRYSYLKNFVFANQEVMLNLFGLPKKTFKTIIEEIKEEKEEGIIYNPFFDEEFFHIKNFEKYLVKKYGRKAKFSNFA